MTKIDYVIGDATLPNTPSSIIAHICNNRGGWGKGFSGALSARYPRAEELYRYCWSNQYRHDLGSIQVAVGVPCIVNMIAQDGYSTKNKPAINYEALGACLVQLRETVQEFKRERSVHMPRIGTGWAGGKWEKIEPLISVNLCDFGISVTVYDEPRRGD